MARPVLRAQRARAPAPGRTLGLLEQGWEQLQLQRPWEPLASWAPALETASSVGNISCNVNPGLINGTPFHEEIQCIPEFLWDAHDFGRDYPLVN